MYGLSVLIEEIISLDNLRLACLDAWERLESPITTWPLGNVNTEITLAFCPFIAFQKAEINCKSCSCNLSKSIDASVTLLLVIR